MRAPGYESPEVKALCQEADKRVREYAAEHQIPQYGNDCLWSGGPAPLVLMLDALIRDNRHLHQMLNLLMEPAK